MLFLVRNYDLIRNREKTYLTAAVAVAATTLTVKGVDANAWADDDYVLVGEIGTNTAEILRIAAAVSDGTSLTITQTGTGADSGGARFVHSVGEPVYRLSYNRVEFSRNTTDTSVGSSVLATNEIQADDIYTRYEDTSNTTGFGFVRFNSQVASSFSAYSDGIPYTGYGAKALGRIMKMVRRLLNNPDVQLVDDEDIIEQVNENQRDVAHERLWPFYEDIFSDSRVAYQRDYTIDGDVVLGKVHTVTVESEPLAKVDAHRFDTLFWDTATTGESTHFSVWNNKIRVYPVPSSAASTTTLNGNITATAVSITVVSTSGFAPSGRIIIDSEIISYENISSTQFRGCTRGLEESTAATHTDTTTVTERDIIYTAHREPNELLDPNDETLIPDPAVLAYGASAELAIGKMNDKTLHDRLKLKYDEARKNLREKFGRKGTFSYFRIKDKEEVVSDTGRLRNPNDFPVIT